MTTHDPALVETVARAICDGRTEARLSAWPDLSVSLQHYYFARARAALDAITTSPRRALIELPEPDDIANEFVFRNGGVRQYDSNGFGAYRFFTAKEIPALVAALMSLTRAAESGSTATENRE